jgi:hypothetical protein
MELFDDAWGSSLIRQTYEDFRDRRRGNAARFAGRHGFIRPVGEQGKVVWIRTGAERRQVHLAVELLLAIRARRKDVRLVLTYEHEYPDLISRLEESDRTGWGYAPSDRTQAIESVMSRFKPLGILFVGVDPRPNLARELSGRPRLLGIGNTPWTEWEKHYPDRIWSASEVETVMPVDFHIGFVEAQVEPNFPALVNAGREANLWWAQGVDAAFVRAWRQQFPEDVLFVSAARGPRDSLPISRWQRTPLPAGSVVHVDAPQWLPAIAASSRGIYLRDPSRDTFWQALAAGTPLTVGAAVEASLPGQEGILDRVKTSREVFAHWARWLKDPGAARRQADAGRRWFWAQRRLASETSAELVERVFEW